MLLCCPCCVTAAVDGRGRVSRARQKHSALRLLNTMNLSSCVTVVPLLRSCTTQKFRVWQIPQQKQCQGLFFKKMIVLKKNTHQYDAFPLQGDVCNYTVTFKNFLMPVEQKITTQYSCLTLLNSQIQRLVPLSKVICIFHITCCLTFPAIRPLSLQMMSELLELCY